MRWWNDGEIHVIDHAKSCQNIPRPFKFEQLLIGFKSKFKDRLSISILAISILAPISQPFLYLLVASVVHGWMRPERGTVFFLNQAENQRPESVYVYHFIFIFLTDRPEWTAETQIRLFLEQSDLSSHYLQFHCSLLQKVNFDKSQKSMKNFPAYKELNTLQIRKLYAILWEAIFSHYISLTSLQNISLD